MAKTPTISLKLLDFSEFPGGRLRENGPYSGEQYREDILRPALDLAETVNVDLTGPFAIAPSFLDEAFGPLVKELGSKSFDHRFKFRCDDDPDALADIERIIKRNS